MADPVALLAQCAHKCMKSFNSAEGDSLLKELMDLIDKVKLSQKSPSWLKPEHSAEESTTNFTKWLQKENFDLSSHNLAIKDTQGSEGNGLFTTTPIQKGDAVLKVPRSLMLTTSRALEIPALAGLAQSDQIISQTPTFLLSLVVLVERVQGAESRWGAYLDMLPLTYSIPLFYSYAELALLKECEHTWIGVKKMVINAVMQYTYIHRMLSSLEKSGKQGFVPLSEWTWEAMVWSVSVVLTRQNLIPVSGEKRGVEMEMALIPVWDMCNHVEGEITTFFDVQTESLEFSASQDYTEGDQVYMFYGSRATQHLLIYSGFVPTANTHNNVHIKLDLPKSDPESLRSLKQGLLGSVLGLGPSPSGWWLPIDQNGKLDEKLGVPFLRICCLMGEEEYEREKGNTSFSSLVSLKNEVAGCQMLVDTVAAILEKFSTKVEDDEKLVEAFRARGQNNGGGLAVSYRVSEKVLLQKAHAALLAKLQHLSKKLKQRNNKKKKKEKNQ